MTEVRGWVAINCGSCNEVFFKAKALARHLLIAHDIKPMDFSQEIILDAVKCDNWQTFRLLLKGLPTDKKVSMLQGYLDGRAGGTICCNQSIRLTQVLNYLNALARGGQISPLTREQKASLIFDEEIKVTIRR